MPGEDEAAGKSHNMTTSCCAYNTSLFLRMFVLSVTR